MTLKKNPNWRGDPTFLPDVLKAFGVEVKELPNWKLWGMGDFTTIWGVMVHHTGANNTSAQYIARNPGLSNALSSQIHLSRTGVATLCGAGIAWHAGRGDYPGLPTNDANRLTIGIEAQGDGQTWPAEQLDAYYRTVAAILWFLDLPVSRCIAHHEWAGRAQGKWDPGENGRPMDMSKFRAGVKKYLDNPPFLKKESPVAGSSDRDIREWMGNMQKQLDEIGHLLSLTVDQLVGPGRDGRGLPSFNGWKQLGQTADGKNLTLVDGVAAARLDIDRIKKIVADLAGKDQ